MKITNISLMLSLTGLINASALTRTWTNIYDFSTESITNIEDRLDPDVAGNGTTWITTLHQGTFGTAATWDVGNYSGFTPTDYPNSQRRPNGSANNFAYSAVQLQGNTFGFWQHSRSFTAPPNETQNLLNSMFYQIPKMEQPTAWADPYSAARISCVAKVPFMAVNTSRVKVHMRMRLTVAHKINGVTQKTFTIKPTFFDVHGTSGENVKVSIGDIIMVRTEITDAYTPDFITVNSGTFHTTPFTNEETFTVTIDKVKFANILEAINDKLGYTQFPIPADSNFTDYYVAAIHVNSEMNPDYDEDGTNTLAKIGGSFSALKLDIRRDEE